MKGGYSLKRVVDIIGAISGLLFVAPLTPFIVLAIKLESRGPAIVGLSRISGGRLIKVYKFRSMIDGAHNIKQSLNHLNERADGPFFKIHNDPRITRVGRFLRKFRLDEFPQLLNVLRGNLSLVGPRPHELVEINQYPTPYRNIAFVKAGVTGLSQVGGASSLPYRQELELDDYYIKNASLGLDAKIVGKTVKIIFSDPTAV